LDEIPACGLIVVGQKLNDLLEHDPRPVERIVGAGISEEISGVMDQLVDRVSQWQLPHLRRVTCLYHAQNGPVVQALLPPFQQMETGVAGNRLPPVLNLSPSDFLAELTDHYLFAALHAMLFASLMAENRRRVDHLDHALNYLNGRIDLLAQKYNQLRQEEIIEEIEVLQLYAEPPAGGRTGPGGGCPDY
jgi:F-type H+-transporting ATPase subunit gamma